MKREFYTEYSRIAIIAALWAASEVFLGNYLHQLNLPFKGMILTLVPCFLLSFSYFFLNKPASVIKIGVTVAIVRMLLSWKFNPNIAISIIMQSIAFYIVIRIMGKNLISAIAGGILAESWTFFQSYFFRVVFMGYNLDEIIENLKKIDFLQPIIDKLVLVFIVLWFIHIVPSLFASVAGINVGKRLSGEK